MKAHSAYSNSPNCFFENNSAASSGGVLFIEDNSEYSDSSNCTFINNFA